MHKCLDGEGAEVCRGCSNGWTGLERVSWVCVRVLG